MEILNVPLQGHPAMVLAVITNVVTVHFRVPQQRWLGDGRYHASGLCRMLEIHLPFDLRPFAWVENRLIAGAVDQAFFLPLLD